MLFKRFHTVVLSTGAQRSGETCVLYMLLSAAMREHRYYVYVVASRSHTLYIGFTSVIEKQVQQHR